MRIFQSFLLFPFCIWLLISCEKPQPGALNAITRTELDILADQVHRDTEEKFHILGTKLALVMKEALAIRRDDEMANHLKRFHSDNQLALSLLGEEIDAWHKTMTEEDRAEFLLRLVSEDYAVQLRKMIPEYKNRSAGRGPYLKVYNELFQYISLKR